jgi:hypothetical protein
MFEPELVALSHWLDRVVTSLQKRRHRFASGSFDESTGDMHIGER